MSYRDGLKTAFVKLDLFSALRAPVSALLGVSDEVELILNELGIFTVFDLATSSLFTQAAEVAEAAFGHGNSIISRLGRIPNSFIDRDSPATPESLVNANISMLREIKPAFATEIKKRMQIETVGDLGRWPAYQAAKTILNATNPASVVEGEINELVPRFGEYPTERHYYKSVVIDQVIERDTTDINKAGPIDISPTVSADFGFKTPAIGAILTFAQSWFAQGMTLGNLLHSVALAPGESTRIAVLDWARQMKGSGQENISEAERLNNTTIHNRAISEIQEAVASEVQTGFSKSSGSSTTAAGGGGFGLSLGPLTLGGSASGGTTSTSAESFTSSSGTRNLAASMSQRVSDATQQAASSVRDRRASVVKEVSEEEHETVSTRILANYNHMHALTIQYFEVIEVYRVNVQLHQAERCIFIPMKLVEFTDDIIERYQGVLANAAVTRNIKDLLSNELGTVNIQPQVQMRPPRTIYDSVANFDRITIASRNLRARVPSAAASGENTPETPVEQPATPPPIMTAPLATNWMLDEINRAARITSVRVTRPGITTVSLPGDTLLTGLSFNLSAQNDAAVSLTKVELMTDSGSIIPLNSLSTLDWTISSPAPLQEIASIRVTSTSNNYFSGRLLMQLTYNSGNFPLSLPVEITPNATGQIICKFIDNQVGPALKVHLDQHRLHYSQAIWRSMDASSIALLLSGYSFEGRPLADQIDPNPVMVAGNYLVFRMPGFVEAVGIPSVKDYGREDTSPEAKAYKHWKKFLNERGLVLGAETASEQLVPVPTSGVFAEAVLGRSNSAERLDATRFWNWQDSPIPLAPPEIASIQMGSRTGKDSIAFQCPISAISGVTV